MFARFNFSKSLTFGLIAAFCAVACSKDEPAQFLEVDTFPTTISTSCRDGVARIYDECSDQRIILEQARSRAAATGKSVLIVYGAEWCIWCHVFEKYVQGQSRKFVYEYEYEGKPQYWPMRELENENAELEAIELNRYVAENFVVANIEGHYSPNGTAVLASTGYDTSRISFVPLFVVLDPNGRYAGEMLSVEMIAGLEVRSDSGQEYRGYDRKLLLRELKKLRNDSINGGSASDGTGSPNYDKALYEDLGSLASEVFSEYLNGSMCSPGPDLAQKQAELAMLVSSARPGTGPLVLDFAVVADSLADVRRLLDAGANPLGPNSSLLHTAATFSSPSMLEYLVGQGFRLEDSGQASGPALLVAVQAGNFENVEWLIENGANVNATDTSGVPVIQHAVICKNQAIADLLLEAGAVLDDSVRQLAERHGLSL